jgi:hypothetical protein
MLWVLMPISHTCPCCCRELGHIRAVPDPHYALGVVVCPRCAYASVRTRHPDRVYWQHIRRLRKSLQQLGLVLIFTALAAGATIGMSLWILPEITARPARFIAPDLSTPAVPFQLGIAGFLVILCGCIARTIYAHLRFSRVLVMFLLLIGLFLNIDWLIARLMQFISTLAGVGADIHLANGHEIMRRMMSVAILLPFFSLGMLIGMVFNRLIAKSTSKRTVRIRRRLRKRRSRLD